MYEPMYIYIHTVSIYIYVYHCIHTDFLFLVRVVLSVLLLNLSVCVYIYKCVHTYHVMLGLSHVLSGP